MSHFLTPSWRVGLIGTGYAARQRAKTLAGDPRVELVGFSGHSTPTSEQFQAESSLPSWSEEELWKRAEVVFIASVNGEHARQVRAALEHGLHVVVEYPLALDLIEAQSLVALAQRGQRLLHVEHIELLSGIHESLRRELGSVGTVNLVSYRSVNAKKPDLERWTFSKELFGFPLVGALSRLSRLIDLVGPVESVFCQNRYFGLEADRYRGCLCMAQLQFTNGALGELIYAKGEGSWQSETRLEISGSNGTLIHEGERLVAINDTGTRTPVLGSRRGLFERDTLAVLDALQGKPLYIQPETSLYALAVASAAERSATSGRAEKIPAIGLQTVG